MFDKGVMDDAEGREIDFRNTILIATSNAGSATIMQACLNQQVLPTVEELETQLRPQLARHFKPAFLGRLKVVPFYPIADAVLAQIIEQKLQRVARRIRAAHQARFGYTPELVEAVLARCTEVDAGARNVDHVLNGTLLPEIAEAVLAHMAQGLPIAAIEADVDHADRFTYALTSGAGTDDAAPAHAAALAAA